MLPSRNPTTVTGTTVPSSSKKLIIPSFEPITPIPASMDDETTNLVLGEDLKTREEDFAGRKVGVNSEEDKVDLFSRDGKETTAIAIAIVGDLQRGRRKSRG